jgi:hypothetical protein
MTYITSLPYVRSLGSLLSLLKIVETCKYDFQEYPAVATVEHLNYHLILTLLQEYTLDNTTHPTPIPPSNHPHTAKSPTSIYHPSTHPTTPLPSPKGRRGRRR